MNQPSVQRNILKGCPRFGRCIDVHLAGWEEGRDGAGGGGVRPIPQPPDFEVPQTSIMNFIFGVYKLFCKMFHNRSQ